MNLLQLIISCRKQMLQIEESLDLQQLPAALRLTLQDNLASTKNVLRQAELAMATCTDGQTDATAKLRLWERKLLDLSLRNNLLNLRLGKNAMPVPNVDICQMEDELQMGHEMIMEQKEIKGLYRTVRTNLEETGANTLFIALGVLRWCEKPGSRIYSAPILLLPVNIVPLKKGAFAIRKRDEEMVLNITLTEFLYQQFGIELEGVSPLPQDAYGIDVGLVLHQLREAVKGHPDWEVAEEAVLGIFSFTKFVIWNDIHTHPTEVMESPLVRSLVEGRLLLDDVAVNADARQMDREVRPDAMAIAVDADSSQLEAVMAAEQGESFVLYGPPGTGKSQTITNLIANALYHEKRVLFVAQKKAALDVVHARLQQIGLAPFCLELHSNKMEKHSFLQQLQNAIEATQIHQAKDFERTAEALYTQRLQLINYVDALHAQYPCGYSIHDCIDCYLSANAQPLTLEKDFVKGKSAEEIETICSSIAMLASGFNLLGMQPHEHPLVGFMPKYVPPTKTTSYASAYLGGESIEKMLAELPQMVENIRKQIERAKAMGYLNKTTRQFLETDYKWKKFIAQAVVDEALTDDIDALAEAVTRWASNVNMLPAWRQYTDILGKLSNNGLGEAVKLHQEGKTIEAIQRSFMAAVYRQMAQDLIGQNPTLNDFNGLQFELIIERYNALNSEYQQLTRQELVARIASRISDRVQDAELSGQLTMLRKRIGGKGRGFSIRAIISQMPDLLPTLCPVMLMSPLSVAQYLEMDGPKFDMVVFDEASQMPTSEAVGAIARAKTSIVVGDPKQMPPTDFFTTSVTDENDAEIDDQESILDDCIALSMPSRYLGWHYRSKHESLIAFSNRHYYDGRLTTFPSVDDQVKCVSWLHVNGYYDYGKTRTNRAEAEAIVAEALKCMEQRPERSIGIIAFSKQQSDLIEDLLNVSLAEHPDLERHNQEKEEPLFVKNLENVQGDERDIILFSVGYGPDEEGRLSMNFGPLNRVGGERRLNVAVSRARYEMKVYSTLLPEQIDERRTQAQGVLDLKRFLKFAQQGTMAKEGGKDSRTAYMVEQIAEALRTYGYKVNTKIGSSDFKIDLGVIDPDTPERYRLGIICDGEEYYRLKTARDREIVRPAVLKMLGWKLMHVWSLEWFMRPEIVMKNILKNL